jgi:antitoxin component YwqK of YwqJK toxin-antitoxin module
MDNMKKFLLAACPAMLGIALLLYSCASPGTGRVADPAPEKPAASAIEKVTAVALDKATAEPVAAKKAVERQQTVRTWRVIRDETRYADNSLSQYQTSAYDASGKLLKEESFNQKRQPVFRKQYERPADSRTESVTTFNQQNEVQGISLRDYDESGRLVRERLLNARKELQSQSEYAWDQSGIPVFWLSKGADGAVVVSTTYKITASKITEIALAAGDGSPIARFEQTWDTQGRLVKKTEYDYAGKLKASIEYLWSDGRLVRENHRKADDSPLRSIKYSYGEVPLPFRMDYFDRQGRLSEFRTFEYQPFDRTESITVYE